MECLPARSDSTPAMAAKVAYQGNECARAILGLSSREYTFLWKKSHYGELIVHHKCQL